MSESVISPLEAVASTPMVDNGWYRVEPFTVEEKTPLTTTTTTTTTTASSTSPESILARFRWTNETKKDQRTNNNDDDLALAKNCPLQPSWKMLLFGDGSPTKLLGLLTGSRLTVQLLSMESLSPDSNGTYPNEPVECTQLLQAPLVRRKVWLMNERSERLGYAVSWWNKQDSEAFLLDKNRPIGGNMATSHLDVYREVLEVNYGKNQELQNSFNDGSITFVPSTAIVAMNSGTSLSQGLWCRYYLMWRNGKPLNLIYEVFSPRLEKYIGPYFNNR